MLGKKTGLGTDVNSVVLGVTEGLLTDGVVQVRRRRLTSELLGNLVFHIVEEKESMP